MSLQKYIDVDRQGNGFILTVKHTVNKKGEPQEIIMKVVHLGQIDHWDFSCIYAHLPTWPRAEESGDLQLLKDRY